MIVLLTAFSATTEHDSSALENSEELVVKNEIQHFALGKSYGEIEKCIINGVAVTCVISLANTKEINGDLYIWNTPLTNLSDLRQLSKIRGSLYIKFNKSLSDIDGLVNLAEIGGDLFIQGNYQLSNCCILKSLINEFSPNVRGSIYINNNMNWGDCQDEWSIMRC